MSRKRVRGKLGLAMAAADAAEVAEAVEEVAEEPWEDAAPAVSVRILRDGVFSEHGKHDAGDIVETIHAEAFVSKGLAEAV